VVKRYLSLISLEEAVHLLKTSFPAPGRMETVPLMQSLGRVVAAPVHAGYSVPEVNIAAMDGIAVRSRDTAGARDQAPVTLDHVARVNTGNIIPPGFDAVVMIEETWDIGGRYQIRKPVAPWQHVRPAGEDIRKNQLVLPRGHVIRAFDIGALATYGITELEVRSVRVGIIPTGSELVPLGVRPGPGQVVESNTIMAEVFLTAMGASCTRYPIVPDYPGLIRDTLAQAVESNDLVLISAGSSAGTRDFTAGVISSLGELIFHGVAVKPGKPAMLGKIHGRPVLGLPGYPLAAQTTLREFAGPLLESWGLPPAPGQTVRVRLSQPLTSDLGFDEFVPVSIGRIGERYWGIPHSRGSAVQMATVKANGYVHIQAQVEGYEACQELDACLTTDPGSIERTLLLAGSIDPALEELADLARGRGIFLHASNAGNMGALIALKRGSCHAAPLSLPPLSLLPICPFLVQHLPPDGLTFVHVATIGQGIASREGLTLGDLTGMRYVNTNRDSTTSLIFDMVLSSRGIEPIRIDRGPHQIATPRAAAAAIKAGLADATICTSRVAEAAGLRFLPVVWEDYELATTRDMLEDPRIGALVTLVNSPDFKERLAQSGGYDTSQTGRIRNLSLRRSEIDLPGEHAT
jgi:molybdopterin molybdotransferase/putative molybdopterin biosynthesis protein